MLTDAERERLYGGPDAVAEADRRIAADVAKWPPLTASQRTRLRALLRPVTSEPAPAVIPRQRQSRTALKNAKAA
jgi:hypothetical protein